MAALLTTSVLTACGDDGDSGSDEGFATVQGEYGEVTVDEKPTRIVVVGGDFVDLLDSIDEQPVAFAGYGDADEATLVENYPWLDGLYTGEFDPTFVNADYKASPEAIAVHEPDLIVGTPFYIEEGQYEKFTAVAPTYVVPSDTGRDWTDTLTDLGVLTGKSDEAAQAIADVETAFADAREKLTALEGTTVSAADDNAGTFRLISSGSWLEDLGLTPAANQPGVGEPFVELSPENFGDLSGEIAFFVTYDDAARATTEADPRFPDLPSVQNDSFYFVDRPLVDAGLGAGPTSLAWLLEQVVPLLEASPLNAG